MNSACFNPDICKSIEHKVSRWKHSRSLKENVGHEMDFIEEEWAHMDFMRSLPQSEYSWLILLFDSIPKAVKHAKEELKELTAHLKWLESKRIAVKNSYTSVPPTQHKALDCQMKVWEELIDDTKTEILFYTERLQKYNPKTKKGLLTETDKQRAREVPLEQFVQGKRIGKKLFVKCPFHAEKTGSFIVYLDQNTWWCYGGCQTGGDVIAFIQKRDSVDFIQAVKILIGNV